MARPEVPQETFYKYVDAAWTRVSGRIEASVREKLSFLGDHSDLVDKSTFEEILSRELVKAQQEYKQLRLEERANDQISRKPGITVYLRYPGLIAAVHKCEKFGYPIPEEQIQQEITPYASKIVFPSGIYSMGMGGGQFYQEADPDFIERTGAQSKPFTMYYADVIRVEGADGELWQNVNFKWDGSPKDPNNAPKSPYAEVPE